MFRLGSVRFLGFMIMIGWILGALLPEAQATLANLTTLKQAYPAAKGISCKVCHQGAIGKKGDLNAYGLALQKLKAPGEAKALTVQEIQSVGSGDADGDGAPNGKEIEEGTGP